MVVIIRGFALSGSDRFFPTASDCALFLLTGVVPPPA
jgi:hypothetical protein